MDETILILCTEAGAADYAAAQATEAGDDLGLVLTAIEFEDEKVSGGRIEEDRPYGGHIFQTFDEPIYIGSAIAQLAGHADAVVVDSLDDWALRLLRRFPDDRDEREAEVKSLVSVIQSRMAQLILVSRKPEHAGGEAAEEEWIQHVLGEVGKVADKVVDRAS